MRLFEFDGSNVENNTLIAIINQLQQDLDAGEIKDFTVDDLLNYFQLYDIILDVNDLYNMITVPPLKNIISNIEGDKVVFKGQDSPDSPDMPADKDKKTVEKMAKRAMSSK